MSETKRPLASRNTYWIYLLALLLIACLAAGFLYMQLAGAKVSDDILRLSRSPVVRLSVITADHSDSWNWDWKAPQCTAAFAEWLAPQELSTLELRLINPQVHRLELPLRALYQSGANQMATAGAWCEASARRRASGLVCEVAPLAATDPDAATTALTGAVAQAVTYALNPNIFAEAQGRPWDWGQWQPLVTPVTNNGWHSVCPTLSAESPRE